jgi:hypothetical protein
LAIAVGEIQRHHALAITEAERVPDYRFWPMIETLQRSGDRTVRFYVCPKGVLASDEEFFPIGTQFVMETSGDRRTEVFFMKKYAALYLSERAAQDREVWMSARCLVVRGGVTRGRVLPANRYTVKGARSVMQATVPVSDLQREEMHACSFQAKEEP